MVENNGFVQQNDLATCFCFSFSIFFCYDSFITFISCNLLFLQVASLCNSLLCLSNVILSFCTLQTLSLKVT